MRRWQSGQLHQTVNLTDIVLRWFESSPAHQGVEKITGTTPVIFSIASKLLCLRALVRATDIFCRPTRRQNSRGGVANTYVDLERSEQIYLVIRDHEEMLINHLIGVFCF